MKTIFSTILISFFAIFSAQISLSGKANLIFKTDAPSWENISSTATNAYNEKGKNNIGYNVGLSLKIETPTSFFIMPELYYTTFQNKFTDVATNTTLIAKSNRVDLPILLGYNLLGKTLRVFIGPVASYNLAKNEKYNDFAENAKNNFTVGYQFGTQIQLKKLILNARYEGAISKDQRDFINKNIAGNYVIRYDSRPNLFIVGLGYQF